MAINSYSTLQTAIASWLARTDLTSLLPDFVTLAESRINRELRTREMIETATGSVSTQALAVPADFIETQKIKLDTDSEIPLEYRPPEDSDYRNAGTTSGPPKWFTIVGDEFRFYPAPDGTYTYTLVYYQKVPALSATNTTNWLLTKAPDVYLFAALAEGYSYLLEEEREGYWSGRFNAAKRALHAAEARASRTSGPHRMRILA